MASDHVINLCESTLRNSTRDVYRQRLPGGAWTYTLRHQGQGRLDIEIRALDREIARWSTLVIDEDAEASVTNERIGRFHTVEETDVRFIISAPGARSDIAYRCDLTPASGGNSTENNARELEAG